MNERIKELAKQALENSLFETIGPTITVGEGENKVTIPLVFAEKFAELIIKECCEVAREWEDDYVVEDTAPSHVDIKIEKHFGVK
jgi:hypothetical protein